MVTGHKPNDVTPSCKTTTKVKVMLLSNQQYTYGFTGDRVIMEGIPSVSFHYQQCMQRCGSSQSGVITAAAFYRATRTPL